MKSFLILLLTLTACATPKDIKYTEEGYRILNCNEEEELVINSKSGIYRALIEFENMSVENSNGILIAKCNFNDSCSREAFMKPEGRDFVKINCRKTVLELPEFGPVNIESEIETIWYRRI